MSDSEGSIDNAILERITRRRQKKSPTNQLEKSSKKTEKEGTGSTHEKPRRVRRRRRKVQIEETEPSPTEETGNIDVVPISDIPNPPTPPPENTQEEPQDQPEPDTSMEEELKLEEERKLQEAHTEAKRLRRVQTRGEVKPSSKVQKIVKRRVKKEPEPESDYESTENTDSLRAELNRMREEINTLKHGFNNGNQFAGRDPGSNAVMSERQSNLLMGLLGRR